MSFKIPRIAIFAAGGAAVLFTSIRLVSLPPWVSDRTPALFHSTSHPQSSHTPSAWFKDAGYLRYNGSDEWDSTYDLLLQDTEGYACDEQFEVDLLLGGTGEICRNGLKVMKSLIGNVGAQEKYLNGMQEMDEEIGGAGIEGTFKDLSGLAGKRILIVGDSLDRVWVTNLVEMTSPSSFYTNIDLTSAGDPSRPTIPTKLESALPMKHECGIAIIPIANSLSSSSNYTLISDSFTPRYTAEQSRSPHQLRIDFAFVFGILHDGGTGSSPRYTTERLAALKTLLGGDVSDPHDKGYDAIIINFGLWDLTGYQRRVYNHFKLLSDDEPGFTIEWLAEWTAEYEKQVKALKEAYGHHIPIYIRLVHDTTPVTVGALLGLPSWIEAAVTRQPTMKPLRLAQMRRAQAGLAARLGLGIQPFARRFEAEDKEYMPDGMHPGKAANMIHTEMVLRQIMGQGS